MKRDIAEHGSTTGWRVKYISLTLMLFSALAPWNASAERQDGTPLAYTLRGQWTAMGTVGHWGHIHIRKNLYDALVTLAGVDGNWRITALEILEEKRVEPDAAPAFQRRRFPRGT